MGIKVDYEGIFLSERTLPYCCGFTQLYSFVKTQNCSLKQGNFTLCKEISCICTVRNVEIKNRTMVMKLNVKSKTLKSPE